MTANTKIEWADHTFNPWIGCTKISPACDNCYAEADFDKRRQVVTWGAGRPRKRTAPSTWAQPVRWNAKAGRDLKAWEQFKSVNGLDDAHLIARGMVKPTRPRVFCASLADVFDNEVPDEWREDLFKLIEATPNFDWLLLTKRIGNAAKMMFHARGGHLQLLANLWIGATICNQEEADRDIPKLLAVPAAKRFLSMEPLLGPVKMRWEWVSRGRPLGGGPAVNILEPWKVPEPEPAVDWVIVGGESGHNARPMPPDWARGLRDQCQSAGVAFFFKQWGEHVGGELQPNPHFPGDSGAWRLDQRGERWHTPGEGLKPRKEWEPIKFVRVGKKAAGRMLDGREWNEVPA